MNCLLFQGKGISSLITVLHPTELAINWIKVALTYINQFVPCVFSSVFHSLAEPNSDSSTFFCINSCPEPFE